MSLISQRSLAAAFGKPDQDLPISFDRARPLAFMHVPKTSGVAVTAGLASALAPPIFVEGFDYCSFDSYRNFETVDQSIRCMIYESPESLPQPAHLIAGHFALSTLRQAYPNAQCFTVLREPYSRLLSHWLFWRSHTDEELVPWGSLAERVQKSRRPFADFLSDPMLACQTDNLVLRMLLWPHSLLPAGRFIDPADDGRLLREATARLNEFDFVDIVENEAFENRLEMWLGCSFRHGRTNETRPIPRPFRTPLRGELTLETLELLEFRSRLDFRLWAEIAQRRLPGSKISRLRQQTVLANIARYEVLLSG